MKLKFHDFVSHGIQDPNSTDLVLCWVCLVSGTPDSRLDRRFELQELQGCLSSFFDSQGISLKFREFLQDPRGFEVGFGFTTHSCRDSVLSLDIYGMDEAVLDCNEAASVRLLKRSAWCQNMTYNDTIKERKARKGERIEGQVWP